MSKYVTQAQGKTLVCWNIKKATEQAKEWYNCCRLWCLHKSSVVRMVTKVSVNRWESYIWTVNHLSKRQDRFQWECLYSGEFTLPNQLVKQAIHFNCCTRLFLVSVFSRIWLCSVVLKRYDFLSIAPDTYSFMVFLSSFFISLYPIYTLGMWKWRSSNWPELHHASSILWVLHMCGPANIILCTSMFSWVLSMPTWKKTIVQNTTLWRFWRVHLQT